jgi:hypothetical protein
MLTRRSAGRAPVTFVFAHMTAEDISISGAARLPVTISGTWSSTPKRDWQGFASSVEPIVAISFLRCNGRVEWCLSERPTGSRMDVGLALFPFDMRGIDVEVNLSIGGGGRRYRSILPKPGYYPTIPMTASFETGRTILISRIEGDPCIDFLGLFLAKWDTKTGRGGIWHIRPHLRQSLPDRMLAALTYGRTGEFEEREWEQTAPQDR